MTSTHRARHTHERGCLRTEGISAPCGNCGITPAIVHVTEAEPVQLLCQACCPCGKNRTAEKSAATAQLPERQRVADLSFRDAQTESHQTESHGR